MNSKCDKYQKMIPDFFEDELEEGDLSEFLDHIASCKTCRDELSFQYLLYDGLSMLVVQAVRAAEIFTGGKIEDRMISEVYEAVAKEMYV